MQIFILYTLLALATGSAVIELTDENFKENLSNHENSVVLFYAPWCGHCKRFKPELEAAAEEFVRMYPPVNVAAVDCTGAGKATCDSYNLGGFPTIKIFKRNAVEEDYSGPRTSEGLIKHIKQLWGSGSLEVDEKTLEKLVAETKVPILVGYFPNESALKKEFLKLIKKLNEKVQFTQFKDAEIPERVVMYRPKYLENTFDRSVLSYDGDGSNIEDFLVKNYHGLVGHRTVDNKEDFKEPLIIGYFNIDYELNPKGTNYWRNRIAKVAKNYTDKVTFAISSLDDFNEEVYELGSDYQSRKSPIIIGRHSKDNKYVMEEELNIIDFERFVVSFLDFTLEPYLKSQAIPESNEGLVKVAVARNFQEVVLQNGKDTLLEFYAPWCGYCKKLEKVYNETAEKLIDEDVVLIKMDAVNNEVPPPFKVGSFPLLYWLNKDGKDSPIEYMGGQTTNDFIEYIAKYATDELKGWDRDGAPKERQQDL